MIHLAVRNGQVSEAGEARRQGVTFLAISYDQTGPGMTLYDQISGITPSSSITGSTPTFRVKAGSGLGDRNYAARLISISCSNR
jgi:hypothetical protein